MLKNCKRLDSGELCLFYYLYLRHIYSIGSREINARQFIYGIKVRHIYSIGRREINERQFIYGIKVRHIYSIGCRENK